MWKPIYSFKPFAQVTGIEGTYRRTCESVMSVLHRNKDSLMAVLEAFVYDPLLNWRLMDSAAPKAKRSKAQTDSSISSSSQEHGDILDSGGSLSATVPKKGAPSSVENGGEFCILILHLLVPSSLHLKLFHLVHVLQLSLCALYVFISFSTKCRFYCHSVPYRMSVLFEIVAPICRCI